MSQDPKNPWARPEPENRPPVREPILGPGAREAPVVIALAASFVLIHLFALYGGVAGANFFRSMVFYSSAFHEGARLHTTVTYAFLHGGWLHLLMNSAATIGLGIMAHRMMGPARFLVFFALTAVGGAIFYAVLSPNGSMVGASGAIFGFLGAIQWMQMKALQARGLNWVQPLINFLVMMVGLNVLLYFATGGLLAWEGHLGGFVTGWLLAGPLSRRE